MLSIHPSRTNISDRFPVASFAISVPSSRFFEVACATDPRLFHVDWQRHRSPSNFYTSRDQGLLRARSGETAWLLPSDQLRRFAGAKRIYYALGSYGSPRGDNAEFTISPFALERTPCISLSSDFTGRSLDRSRLAGVRGSATYGAPTHPLRWGGDDVLEASRSTREPSSSDRYEDGHSPELWDEEDGGRSGGRLAEQAAYDQGIALEQSDVESDFSIEDDAPGASDVADLVSDGGAEKPSQAGAASWDEHGGWDAAAGWDDSGALEETELSDEPLEGYEDGAAFYGDGGARPAQDGAGDDADEWDGYEDAAELYGAVGAGDGGWSEPEGAADVATLAPEHDAWPTTPDSDHAYGGAAAPEVTEGRDPGYRESEEDEELLPVGRASLALGTAPLDIPEKVRLLRVVAAFESGRDGYAAVNADREFSDPKHPAYQKYHIGLSWGLIQFTQRSGMLGRVLQAAKRREDAIADLPAEHRFASLFGPAWEELLRVTNAADPDQRVAPVAGAALWEPVWTARFRAAGAVPHVTYAQNEVAITEFVDPMLQVARWLGFDTPRSLAMLVDRCIHMGPGGGLAWIMRAVGPVKTQADRDNALRALGHTDLRAFQQSQAPRLAVDGRWGPKTHAAMTGALRALGAASPLTVPGREAMLQAMVEAARPQRFHARLAALHANRADFADDISYALV
jgi:hypothetical protein